MKPLLPPEQAILDASRSLKEAAIRLMHARGYRVEPNGTVLSPAGVPLAISHHYRHGYPQVTFRLAGKTVKVYVHRFAAYGLFGEAVFEPGIQVRHLGGLFDLDKLALGTQVENEADKPAEVRSRAAGIASRVYWARRRGETGMLPA